MAERRPTGARRRPEKVRVPVAMPDGSAPERWLSNIRVSSFTIMILGLLVLGVIVLAPSLKLLIQQRSQIAALEKSVAAQQHDVTSLKGEVARWNDPAYIEAQARNRLLFVLPGEYSYLVIPEAGVDVGTTTAPLSKHIQTTKIDWVQALTSSLLRAGLSTETKTQLQSPTIPVPTSTGAGKTGSTK
jgi:cell division protein FtsB